MKRLFFVSLIMMLFLPEIINASHYMGGEITWECMVGPNYTSNQQGRYRFHLKLYRECYSTSPGSSAATFGTTETLNTTIPGLASITMSIKSGWPKDISPSCYNPALSIKCVGGFAPNNVANSGAMQEYYYTSDVTYPNGVQITGVPPTTGWMFYNESCCRNPSTNITNASSLGYRLRAIMYPYNGQNANPCFDNSPTFSESPKPVICSSYLSKYNHNAYDKELDSLFFEWGEPLNSGGTNINNYAIGYSYLNPLPGVTQNPNNINPILNSKNGEISFKSYTTGAFVTSTKVTSFKNGTKVSEIWRDVQLVMTACDTLQPPELVFMNLDTNFLELNVEPGAIIHQTLFSFDTNSTHLFYYAIGSGFGTYFPAYGSSLARYDSLGCQKPPCATLSNAGTKLYPVNSNPLISDFIWKTDFNNITSGKTKETYVFNFYIQNESCPVPKSNWAKLIVNLSTPYIITQKPKILATEILNSQGDIKISFNPPADPDFAFNQYEFYTSPTKFGNYTLAGTYGTYAVSNVVLRNPAVLNKSMYYYMRVKDLKNGQTRYSTNSDTVFTNFVDLSVDSLMYFHPVGGLTNVLINISNKGNQPMSNFIVRYDVIGGAIYSQFYSDTLLPGESKAHSFPPIYSNDTGNVTICGSILHNKDFYVNNNMLCTQAYTSIEKLFNQGFILYQNQPNPAKGKTNIQFTTPISGAVLIEIQNIMGQIIYSKKVNFDAGNQNIELNLEDFNSGVYFYSVEMMGYKQSKRMIILK